MSDYETGFVAGLVTGLCTSGMVGLAGVYIFGAWIRYVWGRRK